MSDLDTNFHVAPRYRLGIGWWIMSELARRHPQQEIIETHPGGGMYDCLEFRGDPEPGQRSRVSLNFVGSAHFWPLREHDFDSWSTVWESAVSQENPHAMVRAFEKRMGLSAPKPVPATTPRTLAYRVLAWVAQASAESKHPLRIEWGQLDSSGYGAESQRPIKKQFPLAAPTIEQDGHEAFWSLTAGERPPRSAVREGPGVDPDQAPGQPLHPVSLGGIRAAAGSRCDPVTLMGCTREASSARPEPDGRAVRGR